MAIAMQDAVRIAKIQAQQLFEGQILPNLMLEEVVFDEQKQAWLVTLGYDSHQRVKTTEKAIVSSMFGGPDIITESRPREYKVFQIDASDGRLISMKMRDV